MERFLYAFNNAASMDRDLKLQRRPLNQQIVTSSIVPRFTHSSVNADGDDDSCGVSECVDVDALCKV